MTTSPPSSPLFFGEDKVNMRGEKRRRGRLGRLGRVF